MYSKKEIKDLRQKWLDKCQEYDSKKDELNTLSDSKNAAVDDEIQKKEDELGRLDDEVKQTLNDYHDACIENLNEVLAALDDEISKQLLEKEFRRLTRNNNDWDNAMNNLNIWH